MFRCDAGVAVQRQLTQFLTQTEAFRSSLVRVQDSLGKIQDNLDPLVDIMYNRLIVQLLRHQDISETATVELLHKLLSKDDVSELVSDICQSKSFASLPTVELSTLAQLVINLL